MQSLPSHAMHSQKLHQHPALARRPHAGAMAASRKCRTSGGGGRAVAGESSAEVSIRSISPLLPRTAADQRPALAARAAHQEVVPEPRQSGAPGSSFTVPGEGQSPQPPGGATNGTPSQSSDPSKPRAGSAREKLAMLRQLQQRSTDALQGGIMASTPRMVDARMYTASVQAQRKTSEKLSEANLHIDYLHTKIAAYDEDLRAAFELLAKVHREFGTTGRLAESAAAAVQFGIDPEDAVRKVQRLQDRLKTLETVLTKEREQLAARVPRKVPITWVGAASEVRLVGSFNNWTRGVELSGPDVDGGEADGVLRHFEGSVSLLPGRYLVKFLVDDEWRLAPDWPSENNELGETNNVLEVK